MLGRLPALTTIERVEEREETDEDKDEGRDDWPQP
jgi:hypothetical protein